jgi:flagellar motor component MotA
MIWTYTFAALAFAIVGFHGLQLRKVYQVWQRRFSWTAFSTLKDVIGFLLMANDNYRLASKNYHQLAKQATDPQLQAALTRAHEKSLSDPANVSELQRYFATHIESIHDDFQFIQHMSKYLPLVGMATCLLSLAWLFETVHKPEFYSNFVPAMGFAFSGIFYGLMMTYAVSIPLNARFEKLLRFEAKKGEVILTAMIEMQKRPNPFVFVDKLNGMVQPEDRFAWENYTQQQAPHTPARSA